MVSRSWKFVIVCCQTRDVKVQLHCVELACFSMISYSFVSTFGEEIKQILLLCDFFFLGRTLKYENQSAKQTKKRKRVILTDTNFKSFLLPVRQHFLTKWSNTKKTQDCMCITYIHIRTHVITTVEHNKKRNQEQEKKKAKNTHQSCHFIWYDS